MPYLIPIRFLARFAKNLCIYIRRGEIMYINKKVPIFVTLLLICCFFIGSAQAASSIDESIACTLYFNEEETLSCAYYEANLGEKLTAGVAVDNERENYLVTIRSSKGLKRIETPISESGKKEVKFEATQTGKQRIYITVREKGADRVSRFMFTVNVACETNCDECCYDNCRGDCHK